MNKLIVTLFLLFSLTFAFAQQNHFVYLQTYNNQPFYVKFQNKLLSSSATGYLIIPKLNESNYDFVVGFARNEFPEQSFSINLKGNSGYELKNFADKGWGLFDLQNSQVIMGGNTPVVASVTTAPVPKKNDAFADMLSNVVKDSTIRVDDSIVQAPVAKVVLEEKIVLIPSSSTNLYSKVKRSLENYSNDGLERVYIDQLGSSTDTITVFIPGASENRKSKKEKKVIIAEAQPVVTSPDLKDSVVVTEPTTTPIPQKAPQPKFIEDDTKKSKEENPSATDKIVSTSSSLSMINSDCHAIATEDDFLKLRKRMAAEKTDDNMIKLAKKSFKAKCYSTSFIKNLSVLFLTDQGRYSFFDTAYPFVPDSQNFSSLEKELSDTYYITRFRAMIHK